MVSRLPFFDHNAMTALTTIPSSNQYNVRLLLADHEPNTTSAGLADTLLRFPLLTFLDLSYTTPAKDRSVLSSLSQLEHLQVLKLRGVGLKDADAEFLANAIGTRVRYLDVRNNMLTDMAVRSLLQASFTSPSNTTRDSPRRTGISPDPVWQSTIHGPGWYLLRSPDLDQRFLKSLVQPVSHNSWIEGLTGAGITHLYIANNQITVEGVASLLASSRLHALDVGTVNTADMIHKQKLSPKLGRYPGAEKLVPLLGNVAGENLVYFRAHHAVLTAEPTMKDVASTAAFLPELDASQAEMSSEAELDASQVVHELPAASQPIYELADTSFPKSESPMVASTSTGSLRSSYQDEPFPSVRRGSAFAPEVVHEGRNQNEPVVFNSTGGMRSKNEDSRALRSSSTTLAFEESPIISSLEPVPLTSSPICTYDPRAQKIQELLAKRPRNHSIPLKGGKESRLPYLHPSHIPHLETLVLTDVPSHISPTSPILYTLTRFITACSNEALLASLQAGSDYSLPPGQARIQAEQQRSRSLFGLRRIILEITPTEKLARLTSWKPANQNSSTGDRDSEALWAAATDDFSFFGEEECGIPENELGKYFPMAILNEKVSLVPSDDDSTHSGNESPLLHRHVSLRSATSAARTTPGASRTAEETHQRHLESDVDLVAELAAFRRGKKAEYEQAVRRERGRRSTTETGMSSTFATSSPQISMAHFVEGHWKGEVKVVRNPTPKGRSGVVDIYGNYFEKGYLYP
ncbi:uncharacterized protein N7459_004888 [Penicillium hispanicum]|uniref:uncharacterized protein n=1 Tax=Penicillium hispanicum TaxID=1080232 RepID=UPI002540E219|nr:uncharacterized protein N7459_004888 [Penicillium hispanicum]KAJ5585088.1 hypothetical protein N7459_004888 [Penicillium hispanicum]